MKAKLIYETSDGGTFDSLHQATKHLRHSYGLELSNICHKIVKETDFKYSNLLDFVNEHLGDFVKLKALKIEAENYTDEEGNEFVFDEKSKRWLIR